MALFYIVCIAILLVLLREKIPNELFLILFAADVFLFFAVIVLGNKNRVNKKVKTRKGEIVSEFMLESVVETVIYLVQILLERII